MRLISRDSWIRLPAILLVALALLSVAGFENRTAQSILDHSKTGASASHNGLGLVAPATTVSASSTVVPSTLPAWTTASPIPTAREGYGAAEVGGIFYYIAGFGPGGDSTVNEAYNQTSNSWSTKAPLPSSPRSETVAVSDGVFVYMVGGRPTNIVGRDLWRYDPSGNTWTSLSPMPTARATEHMAVYSDGRIYVIGGRTSGVPSGSGALDVVEIYNIASDTWAIGTSLPQPLADGYAVQLNGKIYVFGGFLSNGTASSATYIYDVASNIWARGASMPDGRVDPAAGVCGGLIYVIGGSTANLALQNSNYAYNAASDSWNNSLSIPISTAEVQGISSKGQIFVTSGGIFGSGPGNSANQVFHCAENLLYMSPSGQPVQSPGSTITYRVKVANIEPFNSWDLMVRSNQTVIAPQSISLTGNLFQTNLTATLTERIHCVNGQGTGCTSSDGPGIIHSSALASVNPNATLSGLLFTITYKAGPGTFSTVEIFNDNLGGGGSCCNVPHDSRSATYGRPPPDFSVTAFPTHVIVGRGSTGSSSVIVTSLNGFTGTVSLSSSVTPPGPALQLSPAQVAVPANSTITSTLVISTTDTVPPGDYNATVLGSSGSKSHSIHFKITIVPDFSISAMPTSAKLLPGATISSTVTLTSRGFSGSLSLSVEVVPHVTNGPEALLNASSAVLSPGGTLKVSLLIQTYVLTPPGNYTVTVTAAGVISHSVKIFLDILAPVLTASPSSGILGTKVVVQGSNFPALLNSFFQDSAIVSFDDMLLGTTTVNNGSFTFVLDVPHAQPGPHAIQAKDLNTLAEARTAFIVLPAPSPLTVTIQVGTIYFPGDTAVISILTTQQSTLVSSPNLQLQVLLIRPDGSNVTLASSVSSGIFRASYTIPKNGLLGTYAIIVQASLSGQGGRGLQTFEVQLSWLRTNGPTIGGTVTIASILGMTALAWRKGYLGRKPETELEF